MLLYFYEFVSYNKSMFYITIFFYLYTILSPFIKIINPYYKNLLIYKLVMISFIHNFAQVPYLFLNKLYKYVYYNLQRP